MKAKSIQLNFSSHFTEWLVHRINANYLLHFFCFSYVLRYMPNGCHIRLNATYVRNNELKSISFAHSVNLSAQRLTRELIRTKEAEKNQPTRSAWQRE